MSHLPFICWSTGCYLSGSRCTLNPEQHKPFEPLITGTTRRDGTPNTAPWPRLWPYSGLLVSFGQERSGGWACWIRLQYLEILQSFSIKEPTLTTWSTVDTMPRRPLANLGLHALRMRCTISSSGISGLYFRQSVRWSNAKSLRHWEGDCTFKRSWSSEAVHIFCSYAHVLHHFGRPSTWILKTHFAAEDIEPFLQLTCLVVEYELQQQFDLIIGPY